MTKVENILGWQSVTQEGFIGEKPQAENLLALSLSVYFQ
jgi:hypothetical protein